MSALFIWSSRRLALTLTEPPDLPLVTCTTSWVVTWFTGSLVKESLVPLVTRSLATTSSGITAATELQPQQVFRLVCFVQYCQCSQCFQCWWCSSLSVLVQIPSHHSCVLKANWLSATMLSQKFKGNFNFFKNNPLSSALPRTVFQPVSKRA